MHISNMHTASRAFIPTGKKAKDDCHFKLVLNPSCLVNGLPSIHVICNLHVEVVIMAVSGVISFPRVFLVEPITNQTNI